MAAFGYYAHLLLEGLVGVFGVRLAEEPRYEVVDRPATHIEVRAYGPRVAAEVSVPQGDKGIDEAFSTLFRYIAGANATAAGSPSRVAMTAPVEVGPSQRIAMTAPVETRASGEGEVMRFFLPREFRLAEAPRPAEEAVRLREVAPETLAVVRFSGAPGKAEIEERKRELVAELDKGAWRTVSAPVLMSYDPPFALPFLRRNEVAVRVERR